MGSERADHLIAFQAISYFLSFIVLSCFVRPARKKYTILVFPIHFYRYMENPVLVKKEQPESHNMRAFY